MCNYYYKRSANLNIRDIAIGFREYKSLTNTAESGTCVHEEAIRYPCNYIRGSFIAKHICRLPTYQKQKSTLKSVIDTTPNMCMYIATLKTHKSKIGYPLFYRMQGYEGWWKL